MSDTEIILWHSKPRHADRSNNTKNKEVLSCHAVMPLRAYKRLMEAQLCPIQVKSGSFLNKICQDLQGKPLCKSSFLSTQTFVMLGAYLPFVLNPDRATIDMWVEFQQNVALCCQTTVSEQSTFFFIM